MKKTRVKRVRQCHCEVYPFCKHATEGDRTAATPKKVERLEVYPFCEQTIAWVMADDDYRQVLDRFNLLTAKQQWELLTDTEVRGYLQRATRGMPIVLKDWR